MQRHPFPLLPVLFFITTLLLAGCGDPATDSEPSRANSEFNCAPDNGGITLPDGFCATLVADSVGRARHLDVAPNGDVYLKTRSEAGGIAALRDTTGDDRADVIERFSDMTEPGNGILWETGMAVHDGYIWASNTEAGVDTIRRAHSACPVTAVQTEYST